MQPGWGEPDFVSFTTAAQKIGQPRDTASKAGWGKFA
jgi:hypothetical protein